jgi:hypothetical protein
VRVTRVSAPRRTPAPARSELRSSGGAPR